MLAREDAEFYIKTDLAPGEEFFATGERDAARFLELVRPWLRGSGVALEIGCGIGRLTLPVARRFDRVIAVDVAPTMLRRLSESCAARGVTNVEPALAGDAWHRRGVVDFAYSRIVFQHIADWDIIADYLRRIADCLADDGVLYAQFDTRPATALYRIKTALPDAVLPRTWRRGVRRIRRVAPRIVEVARTLALEPVLERGAGTFDTEFVFRRRPRHIASHAETPTSL